MTIKRQQQGPSDYRALALAALIAAGTLLLMIWIETQYIAKLNHWNTKELGSPVIGRVYSPLASLGWMTQFDEHWDWGRCLHGLSPVVHAPYEAPWARAAFAAERSRIPCEIFVSLLILTIGTIILTRPRSTTGLHGIASWATPAQIGASSLRQSDNSTTGIILGQNPQNGQLYIQSGQESVMAIGPPGSGKSYGIAIPTLLQSWKQSAFVFDPAGELCDRTQVARSKVGKVYIFDPRSMATSCFNPLDGIEPSAIDDIQVILASFFFDKDISQMTESSQFFATSALELGVALVARAIEVNRNTLSGAASLYYSDEWKSDADFCKALKLSEIPYVVETASKYLRMENELRSNIISSLTRYLASFRSDDVARATSRSDFQASSLRCGVATLYLIVRERDQAALNPLVRMILTRIFDDLTIHIPAPEEQSVLALLDEFPLLRAPIIEQKLATMRKFRVRPVLLAQTITQIRDYYGHNESITGLCDVRVFFSHFDLATQEFASKTCGEASVWSQTISGEGKQTSKSYQEISRPLLLPGELGSLARNRIVIAKKGIPPILAAPVDALRDNRFLG